MKFLSFSTQIPTRTNFILPRGFSYNLVMVIWSIASFFLMEFIDDIFLTGQLKPTFGNFVKTRTDIINRNMTLGWVNGSLYIIKSCFFFSSFTS